MNISTYIKRIRMAKLLLTGAVLAAIASLCFPWDRLESIFYGLAVSNVTEDRSTLLVVMASSLGICPRIWGLAGFVYPVARLALVLLASSFLFAPFHISCISRMTLLKVFWIMLDFFLLAAFIGGRFGASKHYLEFHNLERLYRHLHFLPGFYLAILAALLHFAGLLLIPSSRSLPPNVPPT